MVRDILATWQKGTRDSHGKWRVNHSYTLSSVRLQRGWSLDEWMRLSVAARYEAIAYYTSKATMEEWERMPKRERASAIVAWQRKQQEGKD